MINVSNVAQIREAERGEEEKILIERAADALFARFVQIADLSARVAIFVGSGNNGADGLALAMRIAAHGNPLTVYSSNGGNDVEFPAALPQYDIIFDCLLGTGCNRPLSGKLQAAVKAINASTAYKIAVDIPTGLNADTGHADGGAVKAAETLTFGGIKQGQIICGGRNYCGKLTVCDIGIPTAAASAAIVEADDISMPPRMTVSHKGNYGSVMLIAGSPTMIGGALLAHESATAALRSGCGYASLCVPCSLAAAYQSRVREEMLVLLPDRNGSILFDRAALDDVAARASVIVIGMGLGRNENLLDIICYLAKKDITLVVDADGLNALAADLCAVRGHTCKLVLTPHVGEFRRLTALIPSQNDIADVRTLAADLNAVIAMKSATTIISDGSRVFLNTTGTPAMAKAGSGDVLAGIIGAYAAIADPLTATIRACYSFGRAGERAAKRQGEFSVLASDLIERL